MAQVLQGGDFAAAAHNPVVGSSPATSADCDEILPAWNRGVKDKNYVDLRGFKHARPCDPDGALARLLLKPYAFVIA